MSKKHNHKNNSLISAASNIGIKSTKRKSSLSKALMIASAVPLSSLSMMASAAESSSTQNLEASDTTPSTTLSKITVYSKDNSEDFKKDTSDNVKYTQPLVETPQTIAVVTQELIEEQKAHSLVDALRNTPGITMQLGENGNTSEGDAISMRGFSGDDLILVDGIRNIAPISRDTFNVDSVEITKGGTGTELGRAASGGAINMITKKPKAFSDHSVTLSIDSAAKARVSADLNQPFSDALAGRLNVMYEKGDAIGRDMVEQQSTGVAPSITWGLGTDTQVTASAELLRQRNTPDGGISTVGMEGYYAGRTDYTVNDFDFSKLTTMTPQQAVDQLNAANAALNKAKPIDKENYYGDKEDFEDVDSDIYSLTVSHNFANNTQLTNTTRYAETIMKREMAAPYNAYNTALGTSRGSNELKIDESLAGLGLDINDPDTWVIRTIRQGVDRKNTTIANQTNINVLDVKTGNISHDVTTGLELIRESQSEKGQSRPKNNDYINLYNPDPNKLQGNMIYDGSKTKGQTDTLAAYVYDTAKLSDNLKIVAGLRADNYRTSYESTDPDGKTKELKDNGTLLSYKGALIFQPTQNSSVYANYGVTKTPPGSSNFSLADSGRGANRPSSNPIFDPQETENWEVGTKWELLNDQLILGLAYYNTTHTNELARQEDGSDRYIQFGERTIDGVELSAQGQLTPRWRVNAGIQTMNTEITEGDEGRSAPGAAARWSPELTGTLWTSYDLTDRFTLGGGVRYVGEQKRQTDPAADYATTNMPVIPEYWVADAYASYRINDAFTADLNVYNLFDEEYIDTLNNGGARVRMGEPLNAMLTLKYKF